MRSPTLMLTFSEAINELSSIQDSDLTLDYYSGFLFSQEHNIQIPPVSSGGI